MRLLCFVALPLLLQLVVSAIRIAVTNGKARSSGWACWSSACGPFLVRP